MTTDAHRLCTAMIGKLREVLKEIANLVENSDSSPAWDVYERAMEVLMMESGREVQQELELLWHIAYHAGEIYRPLFPMPGVITPTEDHVPIMIHYLERYEQFKAERLFVKACNASKA